MKATNDPIAAGQSGVMLLEALIAILIFSLGILSLVALQATAVQLTSDAKYRTDATLLANRLIGQMWTSSGNLTALKTAFQTGGTAYNAWLADVSGREGLPGVVAASTGVVATLPTVTVDDTAGATAGQVVITLRWRTPEMPLNAAGHQHVVVSQISRNP
ncbi:type IV pilus modification protein PilV [Accumulibacter sp.]|uniref:type IV pilus modification protein PilV n=1 Tax=Accumulibacter sp. TaxID=2053492 RepID=UPI0025E084F6|nr:type IV pilus modification protein PilV [Accumulibacter sp.]MCM8611500.1 type IV pilus modification protein PilV [Accumulibacter sp.]MCM8635134.1 type IV pilus modification protein PilV [Accumulibacter sp.]